MNVVSDENDETAGPDELDDVRVAALSVDLMDRSKLAAVDGLKLVRSVDALLATGAELLLVDLKRVDGEQLRQLGEADAQVVGFGSHVDDELLGAATEAGIEASPRSVFFRRLADGAYG